MRSPPMLPLKGIVRGQVFTLPCNNNGPRVTKHLFSQLNRDRQGRFPPLIPYSLGKISAHQMASLFAGDRYTLKHKYEKDRILIKITEH